MKILLWYIVFTAAYKYTQIMADRIYWGGAHNTHKTVLIVVLNILIIKVT